MSEDRIVNVFFKFHVVRLRVKREIRTQLNFGHACPNIRNTGKLINGAFGTFATLPQQPKI